MRGERFSSLNPATQLALWSGFAAGAAEVEAAVNAARKAFPGWSALPAEERITFVRAFKQRLEREKPALARLIAEETGKMLWDSEGEVAAMIGKAEISVDAYHTRTGYLQKQQAEATLEVRHRPHGVLAVFGPYNFPGHLPNGHIIPALIAGNAIVFKPSEQTPAVGEAMIKLWQESGLPQGVINLVQGARETGMALAANEGIDGILFTGSAEVGALLHKQFGGRPEKILALEMGGNNPLVVWQPENLQAAALVAVQSAFLSSGQRCTCARRLIIPKGAEGEAFLNELLRVSRGIRVGAHDDTPTPYMGPLISNREAERILTARDALLAAGGEELLPVKRLKPGFPFLTPGIIDVTGIPNRADAECFGPLLQVIRVADFGAAIEEANNTRYGLAAGLISRDEALWQKFSRSARAGIVNWNRPTNGASSAAPFGGVGISGNHRPSAYYAADYSAYPMASLESARLQEFTVPAGIAL